MSKEQEKPPAEKLKEQPVAVPPGHTRVVFMEDEVFSSLGKHRKGEKAILPDADVMALLERNQVVEC